MKGDDLLTCFMLLCHIITQISLQWPARLLHNDWISYPSSARIGELVGYLTVGIIREYLLTVPRISYHLSGCVQNFMTPFPAASLVKNDMLRYNIQQSTHRSEKTRVLMREGLYKELLIFGNELECRRSLLGVRPENRCILDNGIPYPGSPELQVRGPSAHPTRNLKACQTLLPNLFVLYP